MIKFRRLSFLAVEKPLQVLLINVLEITIINHRICLLVAETLARY